MERVQPAASQSNHLYNARIVSNGEVLTGSCYVENGLIAAVTNDNQSSIGGVDLGGDYLLPGFVDLHTDNLENHFYPRPNVQWPSAVGAAMAHDWQMIGAGVTTVLDALSLGDYDSGGSRSSMLRSAIEALSEAKQRGILRADHFFHFRCEVSDRTLMEIVEPYLGHESLKLLSVMDHTPGQRQWRDLAIYRDFRRKKKGLVWTDAEFELHISESRQAQVTYVPSFRRQIASVSGERKIPLASHDDTTTADVDESYAEGVTLCEFPTTVAAARRARGLGMQIVMGSPNIVLGGSHSGNVSAKALLAEGLLDILTSDYVPSSLLQSVFALADQGVALSDAVAMVTNNPARAIGLTDRGRIEPGLRADLLQVAIFDGTPAIRGIWVEGIRVL
ncbi:alpha-D-ribose 1-methylphosphonate 5-triphosphate diphosphatase [Mesorhizobium onobrychidis]|uniref:Alpha-D-ribose 1-methylphosphonate 5-triphosphate diphosphatase n=2 Tax=Mesorhizobium onobrychidis TaxID=2775404 RepID=A0ABY5R6V6_9HYPH|nr:alpha-D-ribose 1-methylphosphonate 5-triphosphate diphosphatase [Mesorhizobium onobrychidis]